MLYKKEEDLRQLETGLRMLLAEHGISLRQACMLAGLKAGTFYTAFHRNSIDHDKLQSLVHSFAPDRFIQHRNGKLVIVKKL